MLDTAREEGLGGSVTEHSSPKAVIVTLVSGLGFRVALTDFSRHPWRACPRATQLSDLRDRACRCSHGGLCWIWVQFELFRMAIKPTGGSPGGAINSASHGLFWFNHCGLLWGRHDGEAALPIWSGRRASLLSPH